MIFADYLPLIFVGLAAFALAVAILIPSLRNPYLALLVLVAALPFERFPSLEVAGLTLRFNQLAALVLIVASGLSIFFDRRQLRPYPMLLIIVAFLLFALWTLPLALNIGRAASVLVFLVLMIVTSLAIPQVLTEKRQLKSLTTLFVLLAAFLGLFGLFQFLGDLIGLPRSLTLIGEGYGKEVFGFPRVHAFSLEPLYFANFLFLPLGVMLGLFFSKQDVVPRQWLLGSLGLVLVVFLLALSRGAFIAVVPFVLAIVILFLRRFLTTTNVIAIFAGLMIIGTTVWGLLGLVSPEARDRFLSHATLQDVVAERTGESGFGRLKAFEKAVQLWKGEPLTGIGLGNYGPAVAQDPLIRPPHGWDIVNNQYLELLAETGIVGLLLMLLFWGWLVIRSFVTFFKSRDPLVRAVLGGLTAAFIAILIQYNFFSTLYIMHIWVAVGLLVALQNMALFPAGGKR